MAGPSERSTSEPPDQWLPLPEAAAQLGIAENALRSRIKRRTIRTRKDNRGRLMVCLSGPVDRTEDRVRTWIDPGSDHTTGPDQEPRSAPMPGPEMVPRSLVDALVASHKEALERQDRHHQETVSLLLERVDSAECRAEQATSALNDLVNRILTMIPAPAPSWWERWFGVSRRSDIRGGQ